MNTSYRGVVVPMITPLLTPDTLDTKAVCRIIDLFAKHDISPLLMGTTGEGNSVPFEMAGLFVKTAAKAANKRITIYAGLNGNSPIEHQIQASTFADLGADVIVATLPSYYTLTDEQMYTYYQRLADQSPIPVMLYNIKATTGMTIPVPIVDRLMQHPNIVGLKDSERDLERIEQCIAAANRHNCAYFCGWAAQSARSLELGADGIVPSTGNFVPERFATLYRAALEGNTAEATRLQNETDTIATIYQAGRTLGQSLAALKVMMSTKGLCGSAMLHPLTPIEGEARQLIIEQTKQYL